jgi:hypothetical protein
VSEPTKEEMIQALYESWPCFPNQKRKNFNMYQAICKAIHQGRPKVTTDELMEIIYNDDPYFVKYFALHDLLEDRGVEVFDP